MSFDSVCQRIRSGWSGKSAAALFAMTFLALTGCADQSLDLDLTPTASVSMGVSFPEEASNQLSLVDAWRVQLIRPGEGVVAEDSGAVAPEDLTVTVELSVTLNASCETLTVLIELSSDGEVWFRSEGPNEVCAGATNGIQAQQLQWVGPVIGLSSSGLSFSLEEGGDPLTQTLTVTNQGGGTLNWSASEDRWWLSISPTSGSLGAGQSEAIQVTVTDLDLTAGQYQGVIAVTDPNAINSPQTAPVTLNYVLRPRIGLSTGSLSFTTEEGVDPAPETLIITNVGGGTLDWTASANAEWLTVAPLAGQLGPGQSHSVVVSASPGELPGGVQQAAITISDPNAINSPRTVAVQMTVIARPLIGLNPAALSFSTYEGKDPNAQLLTISNEGGQILNWTATLDDVGWLELSSFGGALGSGQSQAITVLASAADLDQGEYNASITFSDPLALNSPQVLPVTLTITQGPLIGLSTTVVTLSMFPGESPFLEYNMTISNAGGGVLDWQATANVPWIRLEPNSGSLGTIAGVGLAQSLRIDIVDPLKIPAGNYQGLVTVSAPGAQNSPRTIWVNLVVQERAPPVISNLAVKLTKMNDPTCQNPQGAGSRFRATFSYSDVNGDIPIQDGKFFGTPMEVTAGFPDFNPTVSYATADVEGTGFSGQAGFDLCIYFDFHGGANLWIRLMDAEELFSNQLYFLISRPEGANAPSQAPGSEDLPGDRGVASVVVPGRGGG